MNPADTAAEIERLERRLTDPAVRADPDALADLLHPDFLEFGRSGRAHSRESTLRDLPASAAGTDRIEITRFACQTIAPAVRLATYETALLNHAGERSRRARRSSVWVRAEREDAPWRLRFHHAQALESG